MSISQARQQTIMARAYDAKQLTRCIANPAFTRDDVRTTFYVRLASAHYAYTRYRFATTHDGRLIPVAAAFISADELLDRVKGLLEFDIPMLMLQFVPPNDRRELAAEVVEMLRSDEVVTCEVQPRTRGNLNGNHPTSRFASELFNELVAWFDAVVTATIEADQAGKWAGLPSKSRWSMP